jgi:hypothetical protein
VNTSDGARSLHALRHAPLFVGLIFALAGGLLRPAIAPAQTMPENAAQQRLPHDLHWQMVAQKDVLKRQLALRAHAAPIAPDRTPALISVANCDDSGPGSLRDAFTNAVSGDVIDLTSLGCSSITLSSGALTTSVDDLTINGPGASDLAIDGGNSDRVMAHTSYYGTLTIDGLTIRNGSYVYSGPGNYDSAAPGGCIFSEHNVTISNSAIEHCNASGQAVFGAAVDAWGALTLLNSTISGTTASAIGLDLSATVRGGVVYGAVAYLTKTTISDATISASTPQAFSEMLGGGIFALYGMILTDSTVTGVNATVSAAMDAYAKGGGVATPTTVIMSGSTISNNSVHGTPGFGNYGGEISTSAIGGGGVYILSTPHVGQAPPSSITNSTISGNSAICDGAVGAFTIGGGGGLVTWQGIPMTFTNSTLSGNSTNLNGGAVYTSHRGAFVLANTTITDNSAPNGSAIVNNSNLSEYDFVTYGSIIASNHSPGGTATTEIVSIHPISGENNLIASANVALPLGTLSSDPLLGPLADNGGPTMTHALLPGSPAIDTGNNFAGVTTDQRGNGFARELGAAPDIGAYERHPDAIFANGFD